MAAFSPAGVEFVAKGLTGYLNDLSRADKAQQALGRSASGIGSHFANAGAGVNSFAQTLGSSSSGVSGFVAALGNMATVAGGIVAAQLFNKIAEGVGAFISTGFDAVDTAQRLETGLGALLTMNNLYERTTNTLTVAVEGFAEAQADAARKSDDLAFKQKELTAEINTQNASIQEQRQRIIQMADGLDKNQQIARLQEMEVALEGMQRELANAGTEQEKLNNLTQEYTTVTETSFTQTMGFAEAQKLAAEQSKELLAFVEKLSIVSPFEQDQVAQVSKLAVAAGLGVDEVKSFTAGFLDLAAAVGIGSESLDFAADQLLQVAKVGKITTVDLRQLRRLGIDLEKIIGTQMSMSIEEFNAKAAQSPEVFNDLFNAVTQFSQNTFAGTAEKMALSLSGLKSTFTDIFRVSSKNLLRPIVEAVSPIAANILGSLASIATGPELAQIGQDIGKKVAEGIAFVTEKATELFSAFQTGGFTGLGGVLGVPPEAIESITNVAIEIQRLFDIFATGFQESGLQGGLSALFGDLFGQAGAFFSDLAAEIFPQIPAFLGGLVMTITNHLRNNVPVIQEAMAEWGTAIWAWVQVAAAQTATVLQGLIASIAAWVTSAEGSGQMQAFGAQLGQQLFEGMKFLIENSPEIVNFMGKLALGISAGVAAITGVLIVAGGEIVAGILQGILESMGVDLQPAAFNELSGILKQIGSDIATIASELGKRVVASIKKGWDAAWATVQGWGKNFEQILEDASEIWNPEKWMVLGVSVMEGILEGLESKAGEVLEYLKSLLPDWIQAMMDAAGAHSPATETIPLGQSLIQGIVAGVNLEGGSIQAALANALGFSARMFLPAEGLEEDERNTAETSLKAAYAKLFAQIRSGNAGVNELMTEFRAGLTGIFDAEEIRQAMRSVDFNEIVNRIRLDFGKLTLEMKVQAVSLAQSFSGFATGFADMLRGQFETFQKVKTEAADLTKTNTKLTETLNEQKEKLSILQQELKELTSASELDTIAIQKKQMAIEAMTGEIEKNQVALQKSQAALADYRKELDRKIFAGFGAFATDEEKLHGNLALAELLQEFLAGSGDQFKLIGKELGGIFAGQGVHEEIILDRVQAQERLNQLLEEQRQKEEEIRKAQQAQQQLQFLQQQINLMKLIADQGLDPANILQGITLGLNASVDDLLAATNNIVQAMVNQINDSLQIHSPSGVMIDTFKQVMAGAAIGLEKGRGMLDRTIQGIPLLNGSLMQPMAAPAFAGGGSGGGKVIELHQHIGQINNGMDEGIFKQWTMQIVNEALNA